MYEEAIKDLNYNSKDFISKQKYMEILQEKYYGNSCWEILEHLKNDDSLLRILAW